MRIKKTQLTWKAYAQMSSVAFIVGLVITDVSTFVFHPGINYLLWCLISRPWRHWCQNPTSLIKDDRKSLNSI